MADAIIVPNIHSRGEDQLPISATGNTLCIYETSGSGPGYLHIHHADDEAWQVLEGTLVFRLGGKEVEAGPGTTVFVPAGVPHDYYEAQGPSRYLLIVTPRLSELFSALEEAPSEEHNKIMRRFESEIVE
ncbi:MAG TPA: cupin domain-containing protein [Anaerolineales bacterium]|nr:cupin domain-containing protein [Anaerolineales bacterium]